MIENNIIIKEKKILIVDDEEDILSSAKRALKNLYAVDTTRSSQLALTFLSQVKKEYDIFIIDVEMPVIDGITLSKEAKIIVPRVITIGMSGISMDNNTMKYFDYFLPKPFGIEELRKIIAHALLRERS